MGSTFALGLPPGGALGSAAWCWGSPGDLCARSEAGVAAQEGQRGWISGAPGPAQLSAGLLAGAGVAAGGAAARRRQRTRRGGRLRRTWRSFGPQPEEPALTQDELFQIEFAREFERDADPRKGQLSDSLRSAVEAGEWWAADRALDDMWKAHIVPEAWMYNAVIECCMHDEEATDETSAAATTAARLRQEIRSWGTFPNQERFQMTPRVAWERQLLMAGCSCHNTLDWKGTHPVPRSVRPVWLLPAQDDAAEHIAEHETELRAAGWKVIGNDRDVIARLRDKGELHKLAGELGISSAMPARYSCPAQAVYPCVIKPTRGTWGKDTIVAYSPEEVLRTACRNKIHEIERLAEQRVEYEQQCYEMAGHERDPDEFWSRQSRQVEDAVNDWLQEAEWEDLGDRWIMQELVPGTFEYSTTLLVADGEILDYACSRYTFSSATYVWPALEYNKAEYVGVPAQHLAVMKRFLGGFHGILNFNYKVRKNGDICIFEVNPRVGGDLVFDLPKRRVRSMLEKLDAML